MTSDIYTSLNKANQVVLRNLYRKIFVNQVNGRALTSLFYEMIEVSEVPSQFGNVRVVNLVKHVDSFLESLDHFEVVERDNSITVKLNANGNIELWNDMADSYAFCDFWCFIAPYVFAHNLRGTVDFSINALLLEEGGSMGLVNDTLLVLHRGDGAIFTDHHMSDVTQNEHLMKGMTFKRV